MTREEFNYLPDGDTLQLINDLEKQKFDLEQQYLDVKNALRLSTNHVNQLQKDKKDLIVERDDYRQQLIKVKEERDAIKKGYDVLCDRRGDLERGINELAQKLADSEKEREQLKRSVAETVQRLHERIEENRKDLLAKDDELVSVKIDRAELQKAKDNLFKEIHRHCEIKDQMEEDLALLKDILKVFVKERNSRE